MDPLLQLTECAVDARHADYRKALARGAEIEAGGPTSLLAAARLRAIAAQRAKQDAQLSEEKRNALVDEGTTEAVDLLSQAASINEPMIRRALKYDSELKWLQATYRARREGDAPPTSE